MISQTSLSPTVANLLDVYLGAGCDPEFVYLLNEASMKDGNTVVNGRLADCQLEISGIDV